MPDILYIVLLTVGAAACIPLGGVLAKIEHIGPNWLENEFRHFMIAFGGGLLLGAVVQVLLPEGMAKFNHPVGAVMLFIVGGIMFFLLERRLGRQRNEAPQLLGMLLDYIPEAMALGGLAAVNPRLAAMLALLIGLQNIPEGFNAYRELIAQKSNTPSRVLRFMLCFILIGPAVGVAAYYFLSDQPAVLGAIMLLASGGIVYLMFQDIAPQSRLRHHWAPPLGAVLGFAFTLLADAGIT